MSSKIHVDLRDDACVIDLIGEVTDELALALERSLQSCFSYYQYEAVTLAVNSPGGAASALQHIVACMKKWRQQGRRIFTRGNFQVSSAGAILVSCGEIGHRAVYSYSTVLYHEARAGTGSVSMTADAATSMAQMLRNADMGMYLTLIDHLIDGFGGQERLCAMGRARLAVLSQNFEAVAQGLGENSSKVARPNWLKRLENAFAEDSKPGRTSEVKPATAAKASGFDAAAYMRYLKKRFALDTRMDLREAWCLGLIDRIEGITVLDNVVPCAGAPRNSIVIDLAASSPTKPSIDLGHGVGKPGLVTV